MKRFQNGTLRLGPPKMDGLLRKMSGSSSFLHGAPTAAWKIKNYDLGATLDSGQVFRWNRVGDAWEGVVLGRWVRLIQAGNILAAQSTDPGNDWLWLEDYLQINVSIDSVIQTFPRDRPMITALSCCKGLRLLRQEPWECLASFILSSTKQITQIRQIISLLSSQFGRPLAVPTGVKPIYAFPSPRDLVGASEAGLRDCKMGFRAPHLLTAARAIVEGRLNLESLYKMEMLDARDQLMCLRGVGEKIAHCVLLFAFGFDQAFPIDVWVERTLKDLYFRGKQVSKPELQAFAASHFGPHAGYAQQYLFHQARKRSGKVSPPENALSDLDTHASQSKNTA